MYQAEAEVDDANIAKAIQYLIWILTLSCLSVAHLKGVLHFSHQ